MKPGRVLFREGIGNILFLHHFHIFKAIHYYYFKLEFIKRVCQKLSRQFRKLNKTE